MLTGDLTSLIRFVIYLAIAGLVIYCINWFINTLSLPQPVKMVALFIVGLIGLIFLLRLIGIAI